jgi:hypothetical protein
VSNRSGQNVPPPPNHLGLAVIAVLLFFPLGIAAVAKSAQVSRLWSEGKHSEALQAASAAKTRAIWAVVLLISAVAVFVAVT